MANGKRQTSKHTHTQIHSGTATIPTRTYVNLLAHYYYLLQICCILLGGLERSLIDFCFALLLPLASRSISSFLDFHVICILHKTLSAFVDIAAVVVVLSVVVSLSLWVQFHFILFRFVLLDFCQVNPIEIWSKGNAIANNRQCQPYDA